jgi:Carboxypeptidase regulatory-like domain
MARSSGAAVILFLVLAGGAVSPAFEQQPPVKTFNPLKGTGKIRGRVTAADTGLPVRRATVRLSAGGGPTLVTATDADGAFEFTGLPAARYTLTAEARTLSLTVK